MFCKIKAFTPQVHVLIFLLWSKNMLKILYTNTQDQRAKEHMHNGLFDSYLKI